MGLLLGVAAARRGDEAWGFLLTALTGLLISPVSWTHHWTIAVAGVVAVIGVRGRPAVTALRASLAIAFGVATSAIWLMIVLGPGNHPGTRAFLLSNLYVLAGMSVLGTAALLELIRAIVRQRARPGARLGAGAGVRGVAGQPFGLASIAPTAHRPLHAPTPFSPGAQGHPGDPVRAITTSQALAADRQSL